MSGFRQISTILGDDGNLYFRDLTNGLIFILVTNPRQIYLDFFQVYL